MDSEELEAIEEEEKLVRDMVKKGTMQQSTNSAQVDQYSRADRDMDAGNTEDK